MNQDLEYSCRWMFTRVDDRSTRTVPTPADELTPDPDKRCVQVSGFVQPVDLQL